MASHAVLYYTHFVSEVVKGELQRLVRELGPEYQLFAVGVCPEKTTLDELASESVQVRSYVREDLRSLPYAQQLEAVDWKTLRRNPDLGIMRFFRDNPNFDYYWIIEYDVRFTGRWKQLFTDIEKSCADLLCTHVTTFQQGRDWMHWDSFSAADKTVEKEDLVRAFLPFSRISGNLMRAIDERCRCGWTGHPEVLWPSIARSIWMDVEEIGGTGPAVPESRRGKYYHSVLVESGLFLSTFGAWPTYSAKSEFDVMSPQDILWHPVKE